MTEKLISLVGLVFFVLLAYVLSEDRRRVSWRLVLWGLGLQLIFALIILRTSPGHAFFDMARVVITRILDFSDFGAKFLFGSLVNDFSIGAIVAFKVLPVIIFVSSLMAVLTHLKIIQIVVRGMAWVMRITMRASGAEALSSALFVFMGIEATTGIKDHISRMTRSELFTVMVGFMATVAGSVLAVYVSFGASAGHLLAASVMSAPAAIVMSKLLIPETGSPETALSSARMERGVDSNVIEAAATGAIDGMKLAVSIAAVLIAFIALIAMLNYFFGFFDTSFETIMGYAFTPVAFIMGVPIDDCFRVGELLGTRLVFNEFLAYQKLQGLIVGGLLSERAVTISTYALCGFASFSSMAVLIGGIGAIAPSRKKEVAGMCLKALLAGLLASFMTATIAGMLV